MKSSEMPHTDAKILYHFVVIDERFLVLMQGCVYENRNVLLSFRCTALGDKQVSESYSSFDAVLTLIPPGTLPTIQFGDEDTIKEFL